MYNEDGSLNFTSQFRVEQGRYIPVLKHANRVMATFVDSIQRMYEKRDLVIIIQGDHGYKFEENDPLFESQSCSIVYAVYCSDNDYSFWNNSISAVNGFRMLFNKYFHTGFKKLPDHSYNLIYR
jgi:membrane-anchored protein YejM (alkaline phosphatase superfamily)